MPYYKGTQGKHPMTQAQQQMAEILIDMHQANPAQDIKVIQLPSAAKRSRKMQLRGRRTCA